ncbi:MAG: VWA domain-containing protein [Desulfobacteraceae bacterium]|nr:MAG: VWA domain-containing protein [Desulfobacteraceae bacterium]
MPVLILKPWVFLFLLLIPLWAVYLTRRLKRVYTKSQTMTLIFLKVLLVAVMVLVFADIRLKSFDGELNILICRDISKSTGDRDHDRIEQFMNRVGLGLSGKDKTGLIFFGRRPYTEFGLSKGLKPASAQADIDRSGTNIESALNTALGQLPGSGNNKILLFTDGNENEGQVMNAVVQAVRLGVEIWPVPLSSWFDRGEVLLERLDTPGSISAHTPFHVTAVVTASTQSTAELIILRDNRLWIKQDVELKPGRNYFKFRDLLDQPGIMPYKAIVNSSGDATFENNESISFTKGLSRLSILYLAQIEEPHLAKALGVQGLDVRLAAPGDFLPDLSDLLGYACVILDNVPADRFTMPQLEVLQSYVKDAGGGLIMVGGENSYGPGLYADSPMEQILPVFLDHPTTLEKPKFCLLILVDKSSSMAGYIKNNSKLEAAKIASFSAVEMLNPLDRIGILAFDTEYQWVVPVMPAEDRQAIANALSRLNELGGTDLYPALSHAFETLKAVDAQKKHVIILSDGKTQAADFQALVTEMQQENISISTVAVGEGSDRKLMRRIAHWGHGRTYYTDDADQIPRIFTGDTKVAAHTAIVEQDIPVTYRQDSDLLQGIAVDQIPVSQGMVLTYPKPGSRVVLDTEKGPLLCGWQYGLGRALAFTGSFDARWGKHWVEWTQFERFASQMVRWAGKKGRAALYDPLIQVHGKTVTFSVDVVDPRGGFVNQAGLELNILFPSGKQNTQVLDQIAPGRYECRFDVPGTGAYYLTLFDPEKQYPAQTFCLGIPYSEEFHTREVDSDLLFTIADMTGGRILNMDDSVEPLFGDLESSIRAGRPLWPLFIWVAAMLFIIDVAVRKVFEPLGSRDD